MWTVSFVALLWQETEFHMLACMRACVPWCVCVYDRDHRLRLRPKPTLSEKKSWAREIIGTEDLMRLIP